MAQSEPPEGPLLRIERRDEAGATRLELVGELDLATADPLKLRLELIEREAPATLVVDLRRVTFMDSIGLGILLSHRLRAQREERGFELVPGPPQVQAVFDLTGVRDSFDWR